MNDKLKYLLLLSISLTLIVNYIIPQDGQNKKLIRQQKVLEHKIIQLKKLDKNRKSIEELLQYNQKVYKNELKYFYRVDDTKSKSMSQIQLYLKSLFRKYKIQKYKIDWIDSEDSKNYIITMIIKANFITDSTSFRKLVVDINHYSKLLIVDRLKIHKIAGKYKHKKISISLYIKAFGVQNDKQ